MDFTKTKEDDTFWGRLVESAVGTHLLNSVAGEDVSLGYWREKQDEVDFVLYNEYSAAAFEVKSGSRTHGRGMDAFLRRYPGSKVFSVSAKVRILGHAGWNGITGNRIRITGIALKAGRGASAAPWRRFSRHGNRLWHVRVLYSDRVPGES